MPPFLLGLNVLNISIAWNHRKQNYSASKQQNISALEKQPLSEPRHGL